MITIIDYGVGNLFSLISSLKMIGADAVATSDPEAIKEADKLILPGVGAFADAIEKLKASGLDELIKQQAQAGKDIMGICLGMQIAVIEFARHAVGWADAHSAEFSSLTAHPVIALLPDQIGVTAKGGTMRLGKYPCVLGEGTKAYAAYGTREISERHRHRYEFNNLFREELERAGMTFSGTSPDGSLVEIAELSEQDWYVGCQFHPEFKSRPDRPHPLFTGFVAAALRKAGK